MASGCYEANSVSGLDLVLGSGNCNSLTRKRLLGRQERGSREAEYKGVERGGREKQREREIERNRESERLGLGCVLLHLEITVCSILPCVSNSIGSQKLTVAAVTPLCCLLCVFETPVDA